MFRLLHHLPRPRHPRRAGSEPPALGQAQHRSQPERRSPGLGTEVQFKIKIAVSADILLPPSSADPPTGAMRARRAEPGGCNPSATPAVERLHCRLRATAVPGPAGGGTERVHGPEIEPTGSVIPERSHAC
jgi:hypothetical protein